MKIYLIGFMGCGKTHWGRLLSEKLQLPFFDLDDAIVEQEEKPVTAIFEEEGEEYFRLLEKDVLHMITESHESFIMACGGGTPCYYNNIDYMKRQGTTIWINCSVQCLFQRLVKEREKRPLIKDLTDDGLRSYIQKKYASRKIFYEQASIILSDEQVNMDYLLERIFHPQ
jgi:shikimate kinase